MDTLMDSVQNSTIYSISNFAQQEPVALLCRDRYGFHSPATYNIITCALCFVYVFADHNVSLDHKTFELVIGKNAVYAEGTRIKPDLDKPESVAMVCGLLKETTECWKWQDCCKQAHICCQDQVTESLKISKDDRSTLCPRTWDGYACWPDTPAGERPHIQCPAYVPRSNTERYAYKTCTKNGTWYVNPDSNKEWTDYRSCFTEEHYHRLYLAGIMCNVITIILLVPACMIFLCYKPLRHQHRIRLHLCLMVSSFVTSVCLLLWEVIIFKDRLESRVELDDMVFEQSIGCRLLFVLTRYAEVASFMWMFIEGFHLHRLLVRAFSVPKTLIPYYIFGFGFPLLPVTVYAVIRGTSWKFNQKCWIDRAENYEWILAIPSLAALAANVLFLMRIVFIMVRQLEPHPNEPSNFRRAVKAVGVLVPLFGVQFLLFVYRPEVKGDFPKVYELLGKICSSLQGSLIVLVFCYFNKEVQGHLKTSCLRLQGRSGLQDLNSRSCTMTTHLPTESSRYRMSNGSNDLSQMIPLRPVHHDNSSDRNSTKKMDDNFINGDLKTIPENLEEGLFLYPAK